MTSGIRVALLGTGSMGRTHAHAYATIPDATVVAVLGRDPDRAGALAAPLGARTYSDLDALLDAERPDVVDCCLPTPLHRWAVERAAAHRCQVICEKPLARNVEDGLAMIAAARAVGVQLLVAQVVRFFPEYRRLATAIKAGAVGTPVALTMLRQGFYPLGCEGWYRDEARSGGVFFDLMVHDFDWALQQLGPVERVYARLVERTSPRPFAQGMATVRHRSGAISQITGTWGYPGPFTTMVEVAGDGGLLRHHSAESAALTFLTAPGHADHADVPLPDLAGGEDPYRTQLAHFMAVIAGTAQSLVQPEEALAALALSVAARASAASGRVQPLEEQIP